MQSAAKGPIVVVNCTEIESDAVIVFSSAIEVVPLPNMFPQPPTSFSYALKTHRAVKMKDIHRDVESDIPYEHGVNLLSWL